MKISNVSVNEFKRFSDLTIEGIPQSVRLVILAGPNGNGKSSLFDAFLRFQQGNARHNWNVQNDYHDRMGSSSQTHLSNRVSIQFHGYSPMIPFTDADRILASKALYFRSAYRNEPAISLGSGLSELGPAIMECRFDKIINNDPVVSMNYKRLASQALEDAFEKDDAAKTLGVFREESIGKIKRALQGVFPDLELNSLGNPMKTGEFRFTKGTQQGYSYQNLSGGEKAAFDILLDLAIKTREFDDTVFCIDEPEAHLNPKVQGALLKEMLGLIGDKSQLWIATHAIGVLRAARDIEEASPGSTAILDFDQDFDKPQVLKPIKMSRAFWQKSLEVAMDDLAELVVPATLVACESSVKGQPGEGYDAQIYNKIFEEEYPDARFVSVGSCTNLTGDNFAVAQALLQTANGTKLLRLRDRDEMTTDEVSEHREKGICVLSMRNLEGYMFDDEVLELLCEQQNQPEQKDTLKTKKAEAISRSVDAGNSEDDLKKVAQSIHHACKTVLGLQQAGTSKQAFMRDWLAPLIKPGTGVYEKMKKDIFG